MELFANSAQTTLSGNGGSISAGATSMIVASAALFPSSGTFRVLIDSELIKVTAVSGATFTIARGDDGTTGASHNDGATVTLILTKGGLAGFRADNVTKDVFANRPAAGTAGRIFLPTDGIELDYDNGSVWTAFGPIYPITPPGLISGWTWVNQGGATATQVGGAINLFNANQSSSDAYHLLKKAAPSAPY